MHFSHTTTCRYAPDRLFRTYRDHLVDIAPYIASVERVQERSRTTHADGSVELAHLWFGTAQAVPVFVRPFVNPQLLQWMDHTRWHADTRIARWRIELPTLGSAVTATGTYRFEDHRKGGQVVAEGDFAIDPRALPPAFAQAKPMIERMVVGLLEPMVADAGGAVVRWLDTHGG